MPTHTRIGCSADSSRSVGCCSFHIAVAALLVAAGASFGQSKRGDAEGPVLYVADPGVKDFSGQMIVRPKQRDAWMKEGVTAGVAARRRGAAADRLMGMVIEYVPQTDEYIIAVPMGMNENMLGAALLGTGDYQYVHPDWRIGYAEIPNDPQFPQQWHHATIRSALAWDITTGSPDIVCGFVDSGVDTDHPDLQALLLPGYNAISRLTQAEGGDVEDTLGHGTNVAGCISAIGNNGIGGCGPNWTTRLLPVKLANSGFNVSHVTHGARWAAENGARTASCSVVWVSDPTVQTTGEYLTSLNSLLLWAAGNNSANLSGFDWPDVIVVGATNQSDAFASFTAFGRAVDVYAPGVDVLVTSRGGGYGTNSGTSFSTPMTNGILGLIWSADPALAAEDARDILFRTCIDRGEPGEDITWGWGRIDAANAAAEAIKGAGPNPPRANDDSGIVFTGDSVTLDVMNNDNDPNRDPIELTGFDPVSAQGGTVELSKGSGPEGRDELVFSPAPGTSGDDTFTYTISDPGGLTDTGTVTVFIEDPASYRPGENPAHTRPGLRVAYYDVGNIIAIPDFSGLTSYKQDVLPNLAYAPTVGEFATSERTDRVAAQLEGYVTVDQPDVYTLYVNSSDGSKLWLGDELLIDNDGLHTPQERSAVARLRPGTHRVRLEYFERVGEAALQMYIEGSGTPKQIVPPEAWSRQIAGPADWNEDNVLTSADVGAYLTAYFQDLVNGTTFADFNGDGVTTAADVGEYLEVYLQGN